MSKARFLLSLAAAALFVSAGANAADVAWRTPLHVSSPLEIPGMTLQPGDYVVKVVDTKEPRKTVQFLNADETKVITTVMAIPAIRNDVSLSTHFVSFQRSEGGPDALKSWYYLDNNYGIEFVYPKERQQQLASLPTKDIVVTPAPVVAPAPAPETQVSQNTVTTETTTKAEPVAAPVETPEPKSLPKTGSNLPLIALGGVLMLAGAGTLHIIRQGL